MVHAARRPALFLWHANDWRDYRFLGSSTRACVVGASPPSHSLQLGGCFRSLSEGILSQPFLLFSPFCDCQSVCNVRALTRCLQL